MARKIEIEIVGDARKLRGALKDAEDSTGRFRGALGGLAKGAAFAGGAAALGGLFAVVKTGIGELMESQKVTAQTNAVIRSTGGAAKITAGQVEELAGALSRKSGIDDELIQSGENVLLTFTNIRNEVGRGNDIFNQATTAALDMSVALGQDMQSSVIQLGKALNDPIKGVTALQRVGVSFTADQKEQIKTLVESGRTMDAQKLILAELRKEFGGSAEAAGNTFAGQIAKLKLRFEEFSGELVAKAIPYVMRFGNWINENAVPILNDFATVITKTVVPALGSIATTIKDSILPAFGRWASTIKDDVTPAFQGLGNTGKKTVTDIATVTKENESDILRTWRNLKQIAEDLAPAFRVAVATAIEVVIGRLKTFAEIMDKALPAALNVAFPVLEKVTGAIAKLTGWLRRAVEWLGKLIGKLPDIKLPDIDLPDLPFIGDRPRGTPDPSGGTPVAGVNSGLWDEIRGGQLRGLVLTSGRRDPRFPGDHSKHIYGKAIDMAGAPAAMAGFARWAMGRPGIDEVFYDPLGFYMDRGQIVRGSIGGHSDHVHVGEFDTGGWLQPGWTMAYNGTGRPERVGGGGDVYITVNAPNYVGDHRELADAVQVAAARFARDNGRSLV